ncbi:nucleoside recognition domain-containing protein [Dethiobacter alkaliphilus]|uniref:Nucleoside recognition domain protein n=1 Tax=Dethiobacter alkaliphilus AHT 1 TaxID=555088 RepID=C0GDY5_DETAL|nr:nucleoside recognition domain-containing protein [Dethiobacter alkaliphilus]EEG78279.1 nucleoside recognition domain protein [Dethiobacter alkaliphilus AHT 1]
MVNLIWFGMMFAGLVVAAITGRIEAVTEAVFSSAEQAVTVAFSLISIMTFWLGMMKLIEKSGMIHGIVKLLRPLAVFLYPRIPRDHPAMQAILMNMSANMLGMGSAATPFGLKAMEKLQELNKDPETASDEMCTFLAVNTSSLTIVPTTVVALRAATGSLNPTEIIGTTVIATLCSTIVAITMDRILRRFFKNGPKGGKR